MSFLIGLIAGFVNIGAMTWRTFQVLEGRVLGVLFSSALLSVGYYVGTTLIVRQDIWGYLGFSVGAAVVSMAMAYRRRPSSADPKQGASRP